MKQTILITHPLPEDWIKLFTQSYTIIQMDYENEGRLKLLSLLPKADALFCLLTVKINDEILRASPKLRVIGNMAVGFDNIDTSACTALGIPVGNTPGVLTDGTADLAFGLLLCAARKIFQSNQDIRDGKWKTWDPVGWLGADLKGAKLGIFGMGKIGTAVAKRAVGFGMEILYTGKSRSKTAEEAFDAEFVDLNTLLGESDFVSLHAPLTKETSQIIGTKELNLMKSSAILINTARGGLIDQDALYKGLFNGTIAAAGLDVTTPEPLPLDHPLLTLPNCIITPHIGSAARGTRKAMAILTCKNIIAGLENKKLPHCVNPEVYKQKY